MTRKSDNANPLKADYLILSDSDHPFSSRNKKRRIIMLVTSLLMFGLLCYGSNHGLLPTHPFICVLLSLSAGCWIFPLSQFLSWLFFLRRCQKNKLGLNTVEHHLIANAFKKTRRSLFKLSASTSLLLFSVFLLLAQQPYEEGTARTIAFSHVILLIALSAFLSLMIFLLITSFVGFVLRIVLFPKSVRHPATNSSYFLGENYPFYADRKFEAEEPDIISQVCKNWDHDPMNPASAEYQSTYRRWWHHED